MTINISEVPVDKSGDPFSFPFYPFKYVILPIHPNSFNVSRKYLFLKVMDKKYIR